MVEGTEETVELVGRIGTVGLSRDGVAVRAEDVEGLLHGVGVEVTHDEGGLALPVLLLGKVIEHSLRLSVADVRVVALAVAGVSVALGDGTLGLEVVSDRDESFLHVRISRREFLGERLAGGAGEAVIGEDAGLPHWLDAIRGVDKRGANDIALDRDIRRGLHILPVAACGVEGLGQCLQSVIALVDVAGDGVAVFDLGQGDDVSVEAVDGGDDLGLLVRQGRSGPRTTGRAAVDGDWVAVLVLVAGAAKLLAEGDEVVKDVECADGVVTLDVYAALDGCAGIFPGDGQVSAGGVAGDRCGGLEAPGVVRVVNDDGVLEFDVVRGAQRLDGRAAILRDVGQWGVLVRLHVVLRAGVVEDDEAFLVGRSELLQIGIRLLGGLVDIRRLAQVLGAAVEADLAVGVERVVIRHRVGTGLDEHALERLAGCIAGWQLIDSERRDGRKCHGERGNLSSGDLRGVVELRDLAGDLNGGAELWVVRAGAHVDEDAVGRLADFRSGLAGAAGLDGEAVEAAFLPYCGDDALGRHSLINERGCGARALDLGDGRDGRGIDRGDRICGIDRSLGVSRAGRRGAGVLRRGGARGEVRGVVVGVGACGIAGDRLRVGGASDGGALVDGGGTVTDGVDGGAGGIGKLDRSVGAGHGEAGVGVWGGQRGGAAVARAALDEEVAAGRNRARECGLATGATLAGEVLNGVAGEIDVGVRRVIQLDEVVRVRGAGVSAAAIGLGDDDLGAVRRGVGWNGGEGGDEGSDSQRANASRMHTNP